MANCKEIEITGTMPFDGGDDVVLRFLGQISLPTSGLKLTVDERSETLVPNTYGGKTAMYEFSIVGVTSASFKFLEHLCRRMLNPEGETACHYSIHSFWSKDVDHGGRVDVLRSTVESFVRSEIEGGVA